jgi:hypothetical protein
VLVRRLGHRFSVGDPGAVVELELQFELDEATLGTGVWEPGCSAVALLVGRRVLVREPHVE